MNQPVWTEGFTRGAGIARGFPRRIARDHRRRLPVGPRKGSRALFRKGARLERIKWLADLSPKGLAQSAGFMVNYLYDLRQIEENHERFVKAGEVVASRAVQKLLPPEPAKENA